MAAASGIDRLVYALRNVGAPEGALNLGFFTDNEVKTIKAGYAMPYREISDRIYRGVAILDHEEAA